MATETIPSHIEFVGAMDALDEIIHQKARLGIMSTLMALGEADFKLLKETVGVILTHNDSEMAICSNSNNQFKYILVALLFFKYIY